MNKWINLSRRTALVILLLLSGCADNLPQKTWYQLPLFPDRGSQQPIQGKHLLWLQPIQLQSFLDATGLVYQTSDVSYTIASNNLWASPLDQQLANSLVNSLNQLLPGWLVSTTSLSNTEDKLQLTISGFHGRYDGQVIVSGEWLLHQQKQIIKQPFYLAVQQQQDGYSAMVMALSEAWQQQVKNIAEQIAPLQ